MASVYTLQARNTRKTWLLIFLFIGLVSAVFFVFGAYYNSPIFGFIGLFISLFQAFIAYNFGDKLALSFSGSKLVTPEQAPELHMLVENLAKVAGIPKPKVYISPDKSANAFATGRNPKNASISVNQGLLNILNKNEIEAVLAHEISHIVNRDILIMTVTMVLSGVISFFADFGFRILFWGGGRKRDDDNNSSPIILVIYILVIILAPIVSLLIQLAISRSREYLADASAVRLTRYPNAMISALEKLYNSPTPSQHYSTATSHFFISPPKKTFNEKINGLFSTHPSLEQRIAALKQL